MTIRANSGSTLIEVLIATLVLVSGLLAMAQLFLLAAATNAAARETTVAATLAAQKVEQLSTGALSDATELVEHIDVWGRVVGSGGSPPADAVYTRRWSIETLTPDTVAIRVRVGRSDRSGASGAMASETRVVAIRGRVRS
jgi:type II secretory pathway pseudopilin PulG